MPDNAKEKPDLELVLATLADRQAFSAVIQRYESAMRRYVVRLGCTDQNDVDDVLQNIFIKVFLNLNDYDQSLKFSSWIYRIAHNETISFFRKKKIRPEALALNTEDTEIFFELLADDTDFQDLAYKRDDARVIKEILEGINDKYREVLILRFLEEKNYTEIADILKIPEGTVATLISRGKKELKVALESKGIKTYE